MTGADHHCAPSSPSIPAHSRRPIASTANMRTDGAVSNAAQLPLSATGTLCIFTQHATHVVVDVNGWWV